MEKLKTFLENSIQGNIVDAVDLVKEELDKRLEEERKLLESEVYVDLGFRLNESDDEEDGDEDKEDKKDDSDDEESEDDDEE